MFCCNYDVKDEMLGSNYGQLWFTAGLNKHLFC